ncbi:DUF3307 domain-containing protein [Stenotrophomonas sp. 22385]|uniref:DUF3307 domain-containing protein n=1 Tax=Stenotrophomonas sp. 22385 TaxID=3453915 RepID=UPI003F84A287
MLETFLALVTAHLLADFPLQSKALLSKKKNPFYLLLHVAIVTIATALLAGTYDPRVLMAVALSHAAMDYIKTHHLDDGIKPFALDQIVHLLVIAGLSVWLPKTVADGWLGTMSAPAQLAAFQVMILASATIASVGMGGVVTAKLLKQFEPKRTCTSSTTSDDLGLPGGGEYIGWLERGLTLLFMLIGQPEGIGLMLAAKSVLRFSDQSARAHSEYVIIGTLLSFGWAILCGVVAKAALAHWS